MRIRTRWRSEVRAWIEETRARVRHAVHRDRCRSNSRGDGGRYYSRWQCRRRSGALDRADAERGRSVAELLDRPHRHGVQWAADHDARYPEISRRRTVSHGIEERLLLNVAGSSVAGAHSIQLVPSDAYASRRGWVWSRNS